jgi:hypothetical protein
MGLLQFSKNILKSAPNQPNNGGRNPKQNAETKGLVSGVKPKLKTPNDGNHGHTAAEPIDPVPESREHSTTPCSYGDIVAKLQVLQISITGIGVNGILIVIKMSLSRTIKNPATLRWQG